MKTMWTLGALGMIVTATGLVGCQTQGDRVDSTTRVVAKASAEQEAALLGRMKSLAGEWVWGPGEEAAGQPATEFAVTSSGTAVREIMFRGSGHEMTNMYHLDGPDLLVTHYCAGDNQPRMRATRVMSDRIEFKADGVTNLHSLDQDHMAELTIIWNPDGTITEQWQSMAGGKKSEHAVFVLKRKG